MACRSHRRTVCWFDSLSRSWCSASPYPEDKRLAPLVSPSAGKGQLRKGVLSGRPEKRSRYVPLPLKVELHFWGRTFRSILNRYGSDSSFHSEFRLWEYPLDSR